MPAKYLIIGAGPAGLSAAVALKQQNISFDLFDQGNKVGGIWDIQRPDTAIYESAHFISSKTKSAFEDFPMPANYPDYPKHLKIQAYLESYAKKHQLASFIRFNCTVNRLELDGHKWLVHLDSKEILTYDGVICATGLTWYPHLPTIEGTFKGAIIHSKDYKSMELFKDKTCLIIGGGNSGCDIACDAAKMAKKAFLSLRRGYYFIPKYISGIPTDVYNDKFKLPHWLNIRLFQFLLNKILVGKLENYGLPRPDHDLLNSHPIMNTRILHHLGHGDLIVKTGVKKFVDQTVYFQDGSEEKLDLIILATGYQRIYPFLEKMHLDFKTTDQDVMDLFLEVFSKRYDNLFFMGGIELAGGIFPILSKQAQLIAHYLKHKDHQSKAFQNFIHQKKHKQLNLHGAHQYVKSQRHDYYVEMDRYKAILNKYLKSFARPLAK